MKTNKKLEIQQFSKALKRLEEALERSASDDDLVMDATIQRFEFTIELCWKALKKLLLEEGIEASTPRNVLQHAYAAKWFDNERIWLDMLRDRNLTSHTYKEEQAREIYEKIFIYAPELRRICDSLLER